MTQAKAKKGPYGPRPSPHRWKKIFRVLVELQDAQPTAKGKEAATLLVCVDHGVTAAELESIIQRGLAETWPPLEKETLLGRAG